MSKFTREFLQKIQDKAKTINVAKGADPDSMLNNLLAEHPDVDYHTDTYENDQVLIDFLAIAYVAGKEDFTRAWRTAKKTIMLMKSRDLTVGATSNLLRLLDEDFFLEDVESITDGKIEVRESKFEAAPSGDSESLDDGKNKQEPDYQANEIFNRTTIEKAKKDYWDINKIGGDLRIFENNPKNKGISVYSALKTKLENLTSSEINRDTLAAHREDAHELLSIYSALQDRSKKRTLGDILKHPFKTLGEWIMKGKVKETLQTRYGMNEKQLDTLSDIVENKKSTENYLGISKDGKVLTDESKAVGDPEKAAESLDYDALGEQTDLEASRSLNSSFSSETESEKDLDVSVGK